MTGINLKLLHTFLLAAEHGSFRRAAEESNRSPSAVSMQIRDLEEQVGIRLFVRSPQRANLTPEGRILFEQVRKAMDDVETGLRRLTEVAAQRRGHVKIACAPTLAATRLAHILATFKLRYPRSVVEVTETPPTGALDLLLDQKVELYIGPEVPNMTEFEFEPLRADRLVACVPPEYDDGAKERCLASFVGAPVILLEKTTAIRALINKILGEKGIALDLQYEVRNAHSALTFAAAGLGVSIVPSIAVPLHEGTGYRVVPISDAGAERAVGIITARGYVRHAYSEQLMELIRTDLRGVA
ncbi:LysR family transcriptional regulator [Rhodospirillum sp. A1_3_36]|uniref:LysR family transcriptional regulator n=1 Tax=Rhodospirillum sp. A1_3_36 TaxID=3391666 RepID=UPI0039A681E4